MAAWHKVSEDCGAATKMSRFLRNNYIICNSEALWLLPLVIVEIVLARAAEMIRSRCFVYYSMHV